MVEVKLTKTLAEWQETYVGVQALMQEALPFKESYWVARSVDRLEAALKNLETIRKKMLEEYADKDENGKPKVTEVSGGQGVQYSLAENGLKFQREWDDIVSQDIEITIYPVSIAKLGEKLDVIKPGVLKGAMAILTE